MKKKTRSVRIAKEDNTRAKKLFLVLVGVLIWMSGLAIAVIIRKLVEGTSLNVLSVFQLLIFLLLIIGLWALIKEKPPLHNFILIAAFINFIISILDTQYGFLQSAISILILYLGLRFPIDVKPTKRTLKK